MTAPDCDGITDCQNVDPTIGQFLNQLLFHVYLFFDVEKKFSWSSKDLVNQRMLSFPA